MDRRLLSLWLFCAVASIHAQRVGVPTQALTDLSVDELFQVQVTSVSRKAQQLSRAPAAVYVLTAEDIRRSGATSIPEALQWAPGLTVLPVDGRSWAVSARGSARLYADKILVMVDGRSLYTPLFSGVIWDFINVPLENIEQIEVIRGPGAVMWGPNAVNGVINIITRRAERRNGAEVSVAAGTELQSSAVVNWNAAPSERLAYRVWGKLEDRDPAWSSDGYYQYYGSQLFHDRRPVASLESRTAAMGLRLDYAASARDQLMVQADAYGSGRDEVLGFPVISSGPLDRMDARTTSQGGSAQFRWTRASSESSERTLQFTIDKQTIDYPFIEGHLNNLAVDYGRRKQTGEHNEVYWSVGYQQYWDDTTSRRFVRFTPASDVYRAGNLTLRDEWQPVPGKLLVSLGARLDYQSKGHMEVQPTARLLYTPSTRQSLWVAWSRAARMPNRFDRSIHLDGGRQVMQNIPIRLDIYGSPGLESETNYSAETGYRYQAGQRWSIDTSLFWSYYPRLRVLKHPQRPDIRVLGGIPDFSMAMRQDSSGTGRSYGSETSVIVQVTPGWRLLPSWSYLHEQQWTPEVSDLFGYAWLFNSSAPRHQGLFRSQHTFQRRWQLDWMIRARSRNSALDLPGVVRGDVRLAYRQSSRSELSVTARNVTDRRELDMLSEAPFVSIPLRRSLLLRWTVRF